MNANFHIQYMLPWTTKATNTIFFLWPLRCSFLCFNITTLSPLPSPHFALQKHCLISVEHGWWTGKLAGKDVKSQRKDKKRTGNGEWSQPQELDNFLILFTRLSLLGGYSHLQQTERTQETPRGNNCTWTSGKTNFLSLCVRHMEQVLACWIGKCQSLPQSMGKRYLD